MDRFKETILKLDRAVPRYTSYPTAPHFQKDEDGGRQYQNALSHLSQKNPISLYFHLPFCQKLCWYCGCNTKITQRYAPIEDYLHLMYREIDMVADAIRFNAKVSHIHFGGGSPGLIHPKDFLKLMERIRQRFDVLEDCEIAIELDPREVTHDLSQSYAQAGVNRASLGCQSFDLKVLSSVNRQQTYAMSANAVEQLRSAGVKNISFDLIYGLPHQSARSIEHSMRRAIGLKPDRVSFFGYAHVPWVKKHMRLIPEEFLPDNGSRYDQFLAGSEYLQQNGFIPVGIDHFAKSDDSLIKSLNDKTLRRNFQGYSDDTASALIGFGASSIGETAEGYFQNAPQTELYKKDILDGKLPNHKAFIFEQDDKIRKEVISQLMCYGSIDLHETIQEWDLDDNYFNLEISALSYFDEIELITFKDRLSFEIDPGARLAWRIIASIFDAYLVRNSVEPKHAQAV